MTRCGLRGRGWWLRVLVVQLCIEVTFAATNAALPDPCKFAFCSKAIKFATCDVTCKGIDRGICKGAEYALCKGGCLGIPKCVHKCEHAIVKPCEHQLEDKCYRECVDALVEECNADECKHGMKICESIVKSAVEASADHGYARFH